MPIGPSQLDTAMEAASQALHAMRYGICEQRCLEALALAGENRDWGAYARILLPLQEARRQRRMIAGEGVIRLGSGQLEGDPTAWLDRIQAGCVVLTHPHNAPTACRLTQWARDRQRCVEVLLADNPPTAQRWTLRSFQGPAVACDRQAPPAHWVDTWLMPDDPSRSTPPPADRLGPGPPDHAIETAPTHGPTGVRDAADWFLDACEALGDAALGRVHDPLGDPRRVAALEQCLAVVTDHELLHQALGEAARALQQPSGPS